MAEAKTAEIPFLLIVLIAAAETLRVIHLFSSGIKLYPNPGNGIFTIDLGKEFHSIIISVFDITGKIINSEEFFGKSSINYNLEANDGLYFLEIKTDSGEKAMLKVVKN